MSEPKRAMPAQDRGSPAGAGRSRAAPRRRSGLMLTTIVGLVGVVALLLFTFASEGDILAYFNVTGIVIVFGGVVTSAMVAFQGHELAAAFRAFRAIFSAEPSPDRDVHDLVTFAQHLHLKRILQAEQHARTVSSPFLRLGLQLVVDGTPLDDLMHVLNWRIQKMSELEAVQARFFRTLASLAPGFGLLGTLAGMVSMLRELGSGDIAKVGGGMAVAMLATLYGVVLSNLIFKPIAVKIEQRTQQRIAILNVLLEGIILVAMGRSPTVVADAMKAFLQETQDEVHDA